MFSQLIFFKGRCRKPNFCTGMGKGTTKCPRCNKKERQESMIHLQRPFKRTDQINLNVLQFQINDITEINNVALLLCPGVGLAPQLPETFGVDSDVATRRVVVLVAQEDGGPLPRPQGQLPMDRLRQVESTLTGI